MTKRMLQPEEIDWYREFEFEVDGETRCVALCAHHDLENYSIYFYRNAVETDPMEDIVDTPAGEKYRTGIRVSAQAFGALCFLATNLVKDIGMLPYLLKNVYPCSDAFTDEFKAKHKES